MVDRLVNSEANARRIATVENCFGNSGQPLAIQGRVLVGEGVLTKICRKKSKPRQFFLFNDILVYGNIKMDKKKYNKQHIIPLEEVKLENLEDDSINKNGWLIRTPTKSFAVYAATATEKKEWMAHINKCVQELLKKTGKKPTLEHAAVWIPDAEATICMHCRKTQFTVLNRRHHCRKCGAVVCNPCSSKKFLLPAQSSKPLRVCLSCFETLLKAHKKGEQRPVISIMPTNQESSGEDDSEDDLDEIGKGEEIPNLPPNEKPTFYCGSTEDLLAAAAAAAGNVISSESPVKVGSVDESPEYKMNAVNDSTECDTLKTSSTEESAGFVVESISELSVMENVSSISAVSSPDSFHSAATDCPAQTD